MSLSSSVHVHYTQTQEPKMHKFISYISLSEKHRTEQSEAKKVPHKTSNVIEKERMCRAHSAILQNYFRYRGAKYCT